MLAQEGASLVTRILAQSAAAAQHFTHEESLKIPFTQDTVNQPVRNPTGWCGSEGRETSLMLPDRHVYESCTALP